MAVAPPQLVGNSFVSQYYNVLHHSPHVVHRFYTDASSLTRAEAGPEGQSDTVFTQNGIHEKVMSMDFGGLKYEIKTVDCQDSLSGSVLVMVTGSLSNKFGRRDFVQTFFLAPQEKGYFVLNDIFRYLDEPPVSNTSYAMANGVQEHSPTPESDPAHLEVSESVPVADDHVDEGYEMPQEDDVEDEVVVEETVQTTVVVESEETVSVDYDDSQRGEAPKKSYASILRVAKDGKIQQVSRPQKAPPAVVEKPAVSASPQTAPVASPSVLPPSVEHSEEAAAPTAEGKAIYIKNLPQNITVPHLEEQLQKFGAVKHGATNIKKQQNSCYAFLEFEEAASARAAVQASPIEINGKTVYMEEKRPPRAFRGRGRGRGGGEGARGGRGGYFSNRGGGRGNYEPSNRGGRTGGSRGGYANSNNNSTADHQEANYQPRQENSGNSNSNNSNNNSNYGNGRPRRAYYRNNSANRNTAPAATTMTAA